MDQKKGFLSLLATGFIFGSFGLLVRILSRELTTYQQIAFRQVVSFLLAVLIVFILKQKWSLNGVKKKNVLFYAISFPISVIFYVIAVVQTKIGVVTFSLYAASLVGSFFIGLFFFKEKITLIKLISLSLTFLGLGLFAFPLSEGLGFGFVAALICGIFNTIANSFKKFLSDKIDSFILIIIQMLGSVVIIFSLMLINKENFLPTMSPLIFIVGLLIGGLLMTTQFLTIVGFRNFDLNLGTIVLSSETVFASLMAMFVFGEYLSLKETFGCIAILMGIIITNFPANKYGRT